MREQLADALTQIFQEYDGKPFMVVGDYNAAASSEDRGTGKLLPYETAPDAPIVVLMRLSLTDVYALMLLPTMISLLVLSTLMHPRPGGVVTVQDANVLELDSVGRFRRFQQKK